MIPIPSADVRHLSACNFLGSERILRTGMKTRGTLLVVSAIAVPAIAVTGWLYATGLLGVFIALKKINPAQEQMDQIYTAVATRTLKPDAAGVVALPPGLASATKDGNVYVTRRGDLLMVLFPTWIGKGSNVMGYLRCNRPLTAADTHKDGYSSSDTTITVFAPGAWGGPATPPQYRIPPNQRQTDVVLEKKLENNTYSVYYGLD